MLFHGTATRFLGSILRQGLRPQDRQHVHLSADEAVAVAVGRRYGTPVVLSVAALDLHRDGQPFFQAENGVWLTAAVPVAAMAVRNR